MKGFLIEHRSLSIPRARSRLQIFRDSATLSRWWGRRGRNRGGSLLRREIGSATFSSRHTSTRLTPGNRIETALLLCCRWIPASPSIKRSPIRRTQNRRKRRNQRRAHHHHPNRIWILCLGIYRQIWVVRVSPPARRVAATPARNQLSDRSSLRWERLGIRNISPVPIAPRNWARGISSSAMENRTANRTTTTCSVLDVPIATVQFWMYGEDD